MNALSRLLYPRGAGCLVCGDPRRADAKYCLCPDCRAQLLSLRLRENVCLRCMQPLDSRGLCAFCRADRLRPLRAGYAAYRYSGAAAQLIRALKFGYQDEAAAALAAGMADCFSPAEYDALTPVPLHRLRRRVRGANQARVLCDLIGPKVGLPVLDTLTRTRSTLPQTQLNAVRRADNVQDAFTAACDVQGLRLLLVDDVRTTGATARACAWALLAAGAQSVSVLTAAIAGTAQGGKP